MLYKDLGFKKGYWWRVQKIMIDYLDGKTAIDALIQNVSEEPRAREDELWNIFTSIRPSNPIKARLLKQAEEKCISLGFMPRLNDSTLDKVLRSCGKRDVRN